MTNNNLSEIQDENSRLNNEYANDTPQLYLHHPSIDVVLNVGISFSSKANVTDSNAFRFRQSVINNSVLKGITPPDIVVNSYGVMGTHKLSATETISGLVMFLMNEATRIFGGDCLNPINAGGNYIVRTVEQPIHWYELGQMD